MSTRLYNIPLLPDDIVSKRFEKTKDVYHDPNQVDNFIKDAIRYTGSEPPLFESDEPRNNKMNATNRLTLMEHGRRYDHTPYHPELFLGDTSKDVRGIATEPSLKKVADQNNFRFQKYHKKIFKNDDTHTIIEGLVPENRFSKIRSLGINDVASRLKIFEESTDNIIARRRHDSANKMNLMSNTEQQEVKYIGGLFEQVNPSRPQNKVSQISNTIGAKWESVPDNKFKVSSYSNLYRTKADIDNAVSKVFQMSKQETEYGIENGTIVSKSLLQLMDNIKKSKQLNQTVDVASNLTTDSFTDNSIYANKAMVYNKGGAEILNTEQAQVRKNLEMYVKNVFNKDHSGEGAFKNRKEALDGIDIKQSSLQSEVHNIKSKLPEKEYNAIFQSILQDRKLDEKTKVNYIKHISPELVDKVIRNIQSSKFTEQDLSGIHNRDGKESKLNVQYKQSNNLGLEDYITNVLKDDPKFYHNPNEIMSSNRTETTAIPFVQDTNNFRFDTEVTMDNNYINRTTGPMGSKYLVSYQKSDSDVNPMSEVNPYYSRR